MRIALELAAVLAAILLIALTRGSDGKQAPGASDSGATRAPVHTAQRSAIDSNTTATAEPVAKKAELRAKMLSLPLRFERNEGQFPGDVRYVARSEGITLSLADDGPTLRLGGRPLRERAAAPNPADEAATSLEPRVTGYEPVHELHMRVEGARAKPELEASEELATKTNYFIGNDPSRWRSNVANYGRVTYREILPGIDLVYRGDGSKLEYDFVVAPGASPEDIAVTYEGADGLSTNERGELEIALADNKLVQHEPFIYQEIDGKRQRVDGSFRLLGGVTAGFEVADYDRSQPLVIDPIVIFASYLGGSSEDQGYDVGFDSSGQPIVTGFTSSANFPVQSPLDGTLNSTDAFVSKLAADGSSLLFSTYLGGSGTDQAYSLAVDGDGAIALAGITNSANFPTASAAQASGGGGQDGFIAKLQADGSALIFSTYMGGSSTDYFYEVAVDQSNNVYAAGHSGSANYPVTAGVYQSTNAGGIDSTLVKLSPTGTKAYATYFGGTSTDQTYGLAIRANGNAVLVGMTSGTIPTTAGAYQTVKPGNNDIFVAELNGDATASVFATYLGGSSYEGWGFPTLGAAIDGNGDIFVGGYTQSSDFPTTPGALQTTMAGSADAFVTKLAAAGASLIYSTYLGGSSDDYVSEIAVDSLGRAYLAVLTFSSDFPTVDPTQATWGGNGNGDIAVSVLDPTGSSLVRVQI